MGVWWAGRRKDVEEVDKSCGGGRAVAQPTEIISPTCESGASTINSPATFAELSCGHPAPTLNIARHTVHGVEVPYASSLH